jgi:hypothetical protein
MKTKNQAEHHLLELAAANEDGISPANMREGSAPVRKLAWSPLEVWRTRVKDPVQRTRTDTVQNPR